MPSPAALVYAGRRFALERSHQHLALVRHEGRTVSITTQGVTVTMPHDEFYVRPPVPFTS